MEKSDFSVPRRMSKSAFVILLVKGLVGYAGPFIIWLFSSCLIPTNSVPLWRS